MASCGLISAMLLTGCYTTITHDYSHFRKMSKPDAVRIMSKANVYLDPFNSPDYNPVISADRLGFEYYQGRLVKYKEVKVVGPARYFTGNGGKAWLLNPPRRLNFSSVRRITYYPARARGDEILLNIGDQNFVLNLLCQPPIESKDYLSALLVLCPNVK